MTFAIIETGGKQYRVSEGGRVTIEKLPGQGDSGKVVFDRVLMVGEGSNIKVGAPTVAGATVEASIEHAGKHDKVTVIKYKAKSRYFKKRGHRQPYHEVSITAIKG